MKKEEMSFGMCYKHVDIIIKYSTLLDDKCPLCEALNKINNLELEVSELEKDIETLETAIEDLSQELDNTHKYYEGESNE